MNNHRLSILNAEIQKAVSDILANEISNPLITGIISVTKVDTVPDLEFSKIYISIFSTTQNKTDVFNQICHSAGFIRKQLAQKIDIRKMPFLQFYLDNTFEENDKIERLIAQTKKPVQKDEK